MAAHEGWRISEEEYYREYLALDDRGIVERLYHTHGRPVDHARRDEMVNCKARAYRREGAPSLPLAACLLIEDGPAGVRAAHAAGIKCLALAHSRPSDELRHADWVCGSFGDVDLDGIARAFSHS